MAQPTVTMDTPGVILALAQLFLAAHCSQAAFALPPPGQLGSAFYLQCEDPAEKGDWLSFLGLGLEFFPSADTVARVPYLLVPSGNGTFSLQNLWRGYSEKRFGDFVAIDPHGHLVLVPEADTASRAVFTAVKAVRGAAFYLDYLRAGKPDAKNGWVGPATTESSLPGLGLVDTAFRSSWSFVPAPDAMLPPVKVVQFQVAAGSRKGDWVGFSGTTVCCGTCAEPPDQRGIWGLVPVANTPDGSRDTDSDNAVVYYIQNLWRAPSEPRAGDWLGFSRKSDQVVLDPKTTAPQQRAAWVAIDAGADGSSFYLQSRPSTGGTAGMYIGLAGSKEAVTLVKEAERVAFSFPAAPKPPPPPPPPPPPCNGPGSPDCVCPHTAAVGVAPPVCPPTPAPPCNPVAGCNQLTFLGTDTKTQGRFSGVYGASGTHFFGNGPAHSDHLPTYVQSITVSGAVREQVWPAASTAMDPRALETSGRPGLYKALGFAATSSPNSTNSTFDALISLKPSSVTEGNISYGLSVYLVDFEGDGCSCREPPMCCHNPVVETACSAPATGGRIQSVSVLHAATNASVAPTQVVKSFQGGVYLRYGKLSGDVRIRVSQLCAGRGDAMLNAVFFD